VLHMWLAFVRVSDGKLFAVIDECRKVLESEEYVCMAYNVFYPSLFAFMIGQMETEL